MWLLGLSAVLWAIPACLLLLRASAWSRALDDTVLLVLIPLFAGGILVGYLLWFRRIVTRNLQRIRSLPPLVAVWEVSSPRGYAIVLLMVTMGIVLRSSDLPRICLAGPYAFMGGCLLLGSFHLALEFATELRLSRPS